ncbi:MAG: CbiQ family ECF transporter T component [Mariprofundaceae bacterium]
MHPKIKLSYLLLLAILLFTFKQPAIILGLLLLQCGLWASSGLGMRPLRPMFKRLSLFFIFITLSYAFISLGDPSRDQWMALPAMGWQLEINLTGLSLALLMCLRVFTLVLASSWVQQSGRPGELVESLTWMKVPHFLAVSVDATLELLSGEGNGGKKGTGEGKGGGKKHRLGARARVTFAQIRRGDLSFVSDLVERGLSRAERHVAEKHPELDARMARDIAVIIGISLAIMGLKMVQVLPGLPIAPGHKNLLIIPLFLLAASLTHGRFGGLWTGLTVGVVSFMLGFGKFGLLEVAQFALPGLLADLLLPLARGRGWGRLLQFMIIGSVLGLARFTANFLVIVLAGAPWVAFVLYTPMLFSQLAFGAASCLVSVVLLRQRASPTRKGSDGESIQRKEGE